MKMNYLRDQAGMAEISLDGIKQYKVERTRKCLVKK